ncbi:hypothetical protein [Natrinema sp. 1APR25-10V2]|uniref:DUF7344 domain-containing protein n=1 Tax=Natrinema sp. 1APR25-10V2 TaxID=2951081 RepID=UPI002875BC2F|nr:hypothetical protein [Natrinema sp. 1APR25-10V2]MDS0475077.1 hypothetical protein [Natrinema sp. 1APR25-10V2]
MAVTQLRQMVARPTDRSPELSQDVAFEMLSCRRRRYVIHCLKQRGGPLSLRELVTQLAAWENEVPVTDVTREQRMRVYTALRQSHLPKLDDGNIVSFDRDRGTVELTDAGSQLEVYLDVVPHNDIPWSKYYAGLSVLCTGFLLGLGADIVPFGRIDPLLGAGLVTALFAVSSAAHVRYANRMRLGREGQPPKYRGGDR